MLRVDEKSRLVLDAREALSCHDSLLVDSFRVKDEPRWAYALTYERQRSLLLRCYRFCCNSERNAEHGDIHCTESRREEGGTVDEGKGTEGMGRVDRQLDMDFTI